VVKVTGSGNKRVSLAALIAIKPGCQPRLIYRVHRGRHGKERRKGFTEPDCARFLDAAHQQARRPAGSRVGQLEFTRQCRDGRVWSRPGTG
jgi:putative transposase